MSSPNQRKRKMWKLKKLSDSSSSLSKCYQLSNRPSVIVIIRTLSNDCVLVIKRHKSDLKVESGGSTVYGVNNSKTVEVLLLSVGAYKKEEKC